MNEMKPCPFCGQKIDSAHPDAVYPKTRPDIDGSQIWRAGCVESHGGCGAAVLGDNQEEAIKKWNTRVPAGVPAGVPTTVYIIESERGWGQKIEDTIEFSSYEEAETYCKDYNTKNNPPMGITPDWYMFARIAGEFGMKRWSDK